MDLLVGDEFSIGRTVFVGVLAYAGLVVILRVSGKRTLSQLNAFDFIVTVALGSTLATILLSSDVSLANGLLALALLVALQLAITWTSERSALVSRMVKSEPTALLVRGRLLRDAMRRERVLEAELQAAMRESGLTRYEDVGLIVLETDGTFSVIERLPGWPDAPGAAIAGVDAIEERGRGPGDDGGGA